MAYSGYATKWHKYEILRSQLDLEWATLQSHLREIADYICPRRPRFFVTDNNRGDRKSSLIIDSTGTMAVDTFASGMMGGNTSPTTPWLRLTTAKPLLAENYAAKEWLDDLTLILLDIFAKSDIYEAFATMYYDAAWSATSVVLMEEDFEKVLRGTTLPPGSYRLGLGRNSQVEVLFRQFRMTVRELVETFGMDFGMEDIDWTRFSERVRNLWETDQRETWVEVCHVIMPNDEYDPALADSKYARFTSCYYERGMLGTSSAGGTYQPEKDRYLRETGHPYFPCLVYRFDYTVGDAYGTNCPGMTALGDIKALQTLHKRHAQAVEKMVFPPMNAPSHAQNQPWSTLPNGVGFVDITQPGGHGKFEPMYQVEPNTRDLKEMIESHQFRINQAFYVDVILSLINPMVEPHDMTAREVDERHDEKYMRFGRVLERVNQPVLARAVDIALDLAWKQGLIPDPPEELEGEDIKVEFISAMASSQKLIRLGGIERFTQFVIQIGQVKPDAWDKVNTDNLVDAYAEGSSVPSKCVASDEDAMRVRRARAEAQAMQAQAEAAPGLAKAARDLSEVDPNKDSALTRVAEAVAP